MGSAKLENKLEAKIDYQSLESQRTEALLNMLKSELIKRDLGSGDTFRDLTMRFVADAKYTEAIFVIEEYIKSKSAYPNVQKRAEPFVTHAKELINAIRAKRSFPNLSQLSMSKQQEILDNAVVHFDQLKHTLKAIKGTAREEHVRDLRSTVLVVQTIAVISGLYFMARFINEFNSSLGQPMVAVFNDITDQAFNWLAQFIPFL